MMIYLDNNATTRPAPEVFDAMRPFLDASFGNPSSSYALGREAKDLVSDTRECVAKLLGTANENEIVFTSGGTESDNWAILGALEATGKNHIVTTTVEHDAIRKLAQKLEKQGIRVTLIEVDEEGSLDLDALKQALSTETAVVSTMLANNETGILFPIGAIGEIVKEHSNALFHVDGVNAVGKIAIDLKETQIDLFSISAHKFHGPKGIGALYIRDGCNLPSMFTGGGQETGRRPGTEAVHQIAGLGAAAKFVEDLTPMAEIKRLRDHLEAIILGEIPRSRVNGTVDRVKRLPNTSSISFENTNGEMILSRLDAAGIAVSTGSACNAHDHKASHVLEAMNVPYSWAMGSIRFSLGRFNSQQDIDTTLDELPLIITDLRGISG